MTTKLLYQLNDLIELFIHTKSKITFIKDGYTGETFISHHPAIDSSGSVSGMKNLKYWGKNDLIIRNVCGQSINISKSYCSSDPSGVKEQITRLSCCCSECLSYSNSKHEKHFARIVYENIKSFTICPMCYEVKSLDEKYQFVDGFKLSPNEVLAIVALKKGTLKNTTQVEIAQHASKLSSVCEDCKSKFIAKINNKNLKIDSVESQEVFEDHDPEKNEREKREEINDTIERVRAAGAVHYIDFRHNYYESKDLIIFTVNRFSSCINLAYYMNENKYHVLIDPFVDSSDSNTTSHIFSDLENAMSCINALCMFHQNLISVINS